MLEKQFVTTQSIKYCLHTDYEIEVETLSFFSLGADTNARTYKAQAYDKTCYFIKIRRSYDHEMSFLVTRLLAEAGIGQVILPIRNIHGHEAQRIGAFTLIVYPFIEGEDGFRLDLTDDQWILLGKVLRQLHDLEVPPSLQVQIRHETYSKKWRESTRSLLSSIEQESPKDEIGLKLINAIKEKRDTIQKLVDQSEKLSRNVQDQPAKFVLCHADIHGGNVLIDKNNSIYIVDWDDPMMAPKERDLMFIGGGIANVWNKPREEELFYKGYGKTQVNRTILAYYRLERILEDIVIYHRELLSTAVTDADKPKMYNEFISIFHPGGVVDIALKTG